MPFQDIVLRVAWHWGSDITVVNDPLVEPGRTTFYVSLPFAWGSVDGDRMFTSQFTEGLLSWGSERFK
jgi:hypothetical protein